MKTFTFFELKLFIDSQPDNRSVVVLEPRSTYRCGCVLIHYAQHLFPNANDYGARFECLRANSTYVKVETNEDRKRINALINYYPSAASCANLKLIAQSLAGTPPAN